MLWLLIMVFNCFYTFNRCCDSVYLHIKVLYFFHNMYVLDNLFCGLSNDLVSGIGDKCSHKGITSFTKQLSEWSKSDGYCL